MSRTRVTAIANGNTHGISTDVLIRVLAATGSPGRGEGKTSRGVRARALLREGHPVGMWWYGRLRGYRRWLEWWLKQAGAVIHKRKSDPEFSRSKSSKTCGGRISRVCLLRLADGDYRIEAQY
jgi:hypothetical protein